MEREVYLIVGLGNPGIKYARNRHNIGFHCLRRLATIHGLDFSRRQKRARVASGSIAGKAVILALPQTFMNESGRAVAPLVHFHKVSLDHLMVVYDDLDLPTGAIRIRPTGGSGGHNGIRSIIQHLQAQDFARLRIGIDRPPGRQDPADYVLENPSAAEEDLFEIALEEANAAIETWLAEGIESAMTRHNQGPPNTEVR